MLLPIANRLRKKGKKLETERALIINVKGISGYIKRFQFNKEMRLWETRTLGVETEFRKLQD